MEKGKVTSINKTNQWTSGEGKVFDCYDVTILSDANIEFKGSTMTPDGMDCKFQLDQDCQYTKKDAGKYGFKFKWATENAFNGGGGNKFDPNISVRQSAFNGLISLVANGKMDYGSITKEKVDELSKIIKGESAPTANNAGGSDLPF